MGETNLAKMAGVPVGLKLDGKDYKFSELSVTDVGKLQQWAIDRHLNRLFRAIEVLSPKAQKLAFEAAVKPLTSEETEMVITTENETVEGVEHSVWLMLRHESPKLTLVEVETLMVSDENRDKIMAVVKTMRDSEPSPNTEGVNPATGD